MSDDTGLNLRHVNAKTVTPHAQVKGRPTQPGMVGYGMDPVVVDDDDEELPAVDDPDEDPNG